MSTLARRKAVFLGAALAVTALGLSAAWLLLPRHIVLPISAPMAHMPYGSWYLEEYSTREWPDASGRYLVWRARAVATSPDYASWEQVVAPLELQLSQLGWSPHPNPRGMCRNHMAEAVLLPEGKDGYVAFTPTGSDADQPIPFVCLAAWQPNPTSRLWEVVLQTTNPSLTIIVDSWFR